MAYLKIALTMVLYTFPMLTHAQGMAIKNDPCGPGKYQKGIGVNNNNYNGPNCIIKTTIYRKTVVTEHETPKEIDYDAAIQRATAHEKDEPNVREPAEYDDDEPGY
jgi:hypothetical protein